MNLRRCLKSLANHEFFGSLKSPDAVGRWMILAHHKQAFAHITEVYFKAMQTVVLTHIYGTLLRELTGAAGETCLLSGQRSRES
jgi:hypothetical protein